MGRKNRKRGHNATDSEERWKNADTFQMEGGLSFQVVGINSPTGTLFVRRINGDKEGNTLRSSLRAILEHVIAMITSKEHSAVHTPSAETTGGELCRIGAIWILSKRDEKHPQNPSKWRRATKLDVPVHEEETIRIHSRPARFPSFSDLQVVSKNDHHGFWVVNKPGGCPSHATVDNVTENALTVVQSLNEKSSYATLPQRLDTETCGLLLVATRPQFARYMCRLLESKTKTAKEMIQAASVNSLAKKYRCLAVVSNENENQGIYHQLCKYKESRECVTHYLDTESLAPKIFLDAIPEETPDERRNRWQICRLRITSVSRPYAVASPGDSSRHSLAHKLVQALWGDHRPVAGAKYVLQLEIDLLTGRTHQIRGQLAALGVPIVGDALYGGVENSNNILLQDSNARASNQMALQCCSLEFREPPILEDAVAAGSNKSSSFTASFCKFRLDHAWWNEHLHQYSCDEVA